jgi:hypothetical protein
MFFRSSPNARRTSGVTLHDDLSFWCHRRDDTAPLFDHLVIGFQSGNRRRPRRRHQPKTAGVWATRPCRQRGWGAAAALKLRPRRHDSPRPEPQQLSQTRKRQINTKLSIGVAQQSNFQRAQKKCRCLVLSIGLLPPQLTARLVDRPTGASPLADRWRRIPSVLRCCATFPSSSSAQSPASRRHARHDATGGQPCFGAAVARLLSS